MSVVGIDFGTEFSKVAVAHKGKISMVPNGLSKLMTSSIVGFSDLHRQFGEHAIGSYGRNSKNSVTQLKRWLGRNANDSKLKDELSKWNFTDACELENGRLGFGVNTSEGFKQLSSEQVLSGYLRHLKDFTSTHLQGMNVKDCVITCPAYFDDSQRRSLLMAANLAELNVLRLMNESSAVALQYGLLRELETNTRRVVFVDIGYSNTQVSIVDFKKGELKVLVSECNANVGGRDFDYCLYEFFRKHFLNEHSIDVNERPKPKIRLLKECNRVKKLLSANKDAVLPIDSLTEEKDTTLRIDRETFAQISKSYLSEIENTINSAFKQLDLINSNSNSKSEKIQIHSVEIVGGCTRAPIISDRILKVVKSYDKNIEKLLQTLNGDECVARGATLMCAMLSPNFRVRDFQVQDINYWPISVSYPSDKESGQITEKLVLKRGNPSPCTAKITFYKKKSFDIEFRHPITFKSQNSECKFDYPFDTNKNIGKFNVKIKGFKENSVKEPFIKVILGLDKHGLLSHPQAILFETTKREVEEIEVETETSTQTPKENKENKEKEPMKVDNSSNQKTSENKENVSETTTNETINGTTNESSENSETTENNSNNKNTKNNETNETNETNNSKEKNSKESNEPMKMKKKKKKKKVTKKHETQLEVSGKFFNAMSESEFNKMFSMESQFVNCDRIKKETDEKRNELESYVYDMRSRLEESHRDFMAENERESYMQGLDAIEDWLYGDGENANKTEYMNKLNGIKESGDPVLSRKWEFEHRTQRVEKLKKVIFKYQQFVESKEEKWAHIEKEERQKVFKKVNEADTWITNLVIQQEKRPKYEKALVMCSQIDAKIRDIVQFCSPIVTKPKPKPKPKPKEESNDESQESKESKESKPNKETNNETNGTNETNETNETNKTNETTNENGTTNNTTKTEPMEVENENNKNTNESKDTNMNDVE